IDEGSAGAMIRTLSTVAWLSRRAFSAAPVMILWTTVVSLALAAVPALQVLVIAALIEALSSTDQLRDVAGLLLVMVLIVGLAPSLPTICGGRVRRSVQAVPRGTEQS